MISKIALFAAIAAGSAYAGMDMYGAGGPQGGYDPGMMGGGASPDMGGAQAYGGGMGMGGGGMDQGPEMMGQGHPMMPADMGGAQAYGMEHPMADYGGAKAYEFDHDHEHDFSY